MAWLSRFLLFSALAFAALLAPAKGAEDDPAEVFVRTYFDSWSRVDFATYRACFHPAATVFLEEGGDWRRWELADFLSAQERMQKASASKEVPRMIRIRGRQGPVVFVEAFWELHRPAGQPVTGYDWFTLVQQGDSWKILNLTFWQQAAPAPLRPL